MNQSFGLTPTFSVVRSHTRWNILVKSTNDLT
jgi:hypothetical protein